jgi:CheY-like chemotaxis protein
MSAKILIVDDEPHMRRVTELSIKKGGYDIVIGRNGREALELAAREKPNLIVMDVSMPELDGLAALLLLKADPATADIPVIMLTVRGHTMTRHQAEQSGAAVYLTKPFSPSQLLAEVQRLLRTVPLVAEAGMRPVVPPPGAARPWAS